MVDAIKYQCGTYLCAQEVKDQQMPSPEAPLTSCPWCGAEYNVREESDDYQRIAEGLYLHKCGHLVRYVGFPEEK